MSHVVEVLTNDHRVHQTRAIVKHQGRDFGQGIVPHQGLGWLFGGSERAHQGQAILEAQLMGTHQHLSNKGGAR